MSSKHHSNWGGGGGAGKDPWSRRFPPFMSRDTSSVHTMTGRITSSLAAGLMDQHGRQRRRSLARNTRVSSFSWLYLSARANPGAVCEPGFPLLARQMSSSLMAIYPAGKGSLRAWWCAKVRGVPDDFLTRTKEPKPAGGTGQDESTGKT
ncbi:hypothetical protein Q7C36_000142 [Tachysurus vachellii]|uniref:Uncharacterized protein n=1 Tax=Tachysurus vachellii TaxID=175792 RepID=A0AA88NX44_TACVA|nr:hypothetical protein Q7C36_000142 [Tachysurus vachellii]